jgi:hypothetical protein
MGAHRTVRPCRQHLAPKMCHRVSEDHLQLTPLIAASVGETGGMRPHSGAAGPLLPTANHRWHRLASDFIQEQPSIPWGTFGGIDSAC